MVKRLKRPFKLINLSAGLVSIVLVSWVVGPLHDVSFPLRDEVID
jgi:hypothetical protein